MSTTVQRIEAARVAEERRIARAAAGDDVIVGVPCRIRTLKAIDPRGDVAHAVGCRQTLEVIGVEDDRRGVGVYTLAGKYLSLHPGEFEVLSWTVPPEEARRC